MANKRRRRRQFSSRNSKSKLLKWLPDDDDDDDIFQEDMINQLPDDIVVSILSFLPITEAARTSVLCKRWETLWTLFYGSLVFDINTTPFTKYREDDVERKRFNYILWLNRILSSLEGSSLSSSSNLNDFIVRFISTKNSKRHIDRWVMFALERRVQKLELDMRAFYFPMRNFRRYTFPLEFCTRITQPCGLYKISALTSLCFKYVDITDELIEHFLSNCPLLERLQVELSERLSNLKVTALQLKYLEINFCFKLKSLEISAPNLLVFNFFGNRIKLRVENVPQLVAVSIGREDIVNLVGLMSSYFSQLETLRLDVDNKARRNFTQFPKLTKLKHLILSVNATDEESLLGWTSLFKASPFLHKFTLEWLHPLLVYMLWSSWTTMYLPNIFWLEVHPKSFCQRMIPEKMECPPQCLKVVELVGFVCCSIDVELCTYFLAKSNALERIILNCHNTLLVETCHESDETSDYKAAKSRAMRFRKKLHPRGVDIVVV